MTKTQTYKMLTGSEWEGEQQATTPNKALREFYGDRLASSDGRYGRLTDGTTCAAMLVHGGRSKVDPMERQTRT
jgi:hypothetical protein